MVSGTLQAKQFRRDEEVSWNCETDWALWGLQSRRAIGLRN